MDEVEVCGMLCHWTPSSANVQWPVLDVLPPSGAACNDQNVLSFMVMV